MDLSLVQVLNALASNVDRLLIGRFFGAAPLGLYRQAYQLVMAPIEQLNAPIGSVSIPGLSILQDDPGRYRRYYQKMVLLISLSTMPIAAFGMVYAKELTLIALGPKWIDTAPFFAIFSASALIRPVLGTGSVVLITNGRSTRFLILTLASSVSFLFCIFAGIYWGPRGIAMAHVVAPAGLLLPSLYYSLAGTSVTLGAFFRAVRNPLVASVIMITGLVAFRNAMPEMGLVHSVGSGCVVGSALYLACSVLLPGGKAELCALLSDVTGSLRRGQAFNTG
jgi:PST family polysaccharide transporter